VNAVSLCRWRTVHWRSYAAAAEEIDPGIFDEIFHLNVLGPIVAMQAVIPSDGARRTGKGPHRCQGDPVGGGPAANYAEGDKPEFRPKGTRPVPTFPLKRSALCEYLSINI
jgi:hypothetical protein